MALRSQKAACGVMALVASALAAAEVRLDVIHDHLYKARPGVMTVGEESLQFVEAPKKGEPSKHHWEWPYHEIQQLELRADRVRVVTYRDHRWKLGADREFEFRAGQGQSFDAMYQALRTKLDQRLVAAVADAPSETLWEMPVKHLERFGGSHGALVAGPESITYRTEVKGESRTWRYEDVANISRSGPFQLTVTTYERAKLHYGSRKDFNFQLKQPLTEARYDDLWRRLNRNQGLALLNSYEDQTK